MMASILFDCEHYGAIAKCSSDAALIQEFKLIESVLSEEVTGEFVFIDFYYGMFTLLQQEICERFIQRCK